MRNRTDVVIGVLLVTLLSWAVWEAQGWPARTRFFPLAIGYPVLAMAVMHLAYSLWLGLRPAKPGQGSPEPAAEGGIVLDPVVVRRRTLEISFWAVAFALGLWLLGFKVGGLVMPTIFLHYQARETLAHQPPVQSGRVRLLQDRPGGGAVVPTAPRPHRRRLRPLFLRFLPDGSAPEPVPVKFARFGKHGRPLFVPLLTRAPWFTAP